MFFPLVGNTIRYYTCDVIGNDAYKISNSNANMKKFVDGYYNTIISLRNNYSKNKKVYGYVTAMHPDDPRKAKQIDPNTKKVYDSYVVYNNDSKACAYYYRSNEKYYKFNLAIQSMVKAKDKSKSVLMYEPLFIQVMKVSNANSNYSYKIKYNTTDGVHWDKNSTIDWVNRMINYSGRL